MLGDPPRHSRAVGIRRVGSLAAGLMVLAVLMPVLSGCGDGPPNDAQIREATDSAPQKVFWAGRSFAGLPLAAMNTDGPWITFVYGDCRPDRDEGCSPPLTIQTVSVCDLNPLEFESVPRASRRWRHLVVREYGEGRRMVNIGASTVIVHARGSVSERVLPALRSVEEPAGSRLFRARYPRAFVAEVREVRNAYRRLGSIRRVRDELRISRKAIRFRLALVKELGPRRLEQRSFVRSFKDIPVVGEVDVKSSCEVEPD